MKKLKIALMLLFSLCFSMFLFACGGNDSGIREIKLDSSKAKTEYTEEDKAENFSAAGLSVGIIYKDGMETDENGEYKPVELKEDQYEVDSSAVKWGNAGKYEIVVTPKDQKLEEGQKPMTATYNIEIVHALGAADANGIKTCSVCGAQEESHTGLQDKVVAGAWDSKVEVTAGDASKTYVKAATGKKYATVGNIAKGQIVKITMTINEATKDSAWFTPLMGFRNGALGVLPREDGWVINTGCADDDGTAFTAEGQTATGQTASSGVATTDSTPWEVFSNGTTWIPDEIIGHKIDMVYTYGEDDVMKIEHILYATDGTTVTKTISLTVRVPLKSYEIVCYGEKCTYTVTDVVITRNLVMDTFTQKSPMTKLVYAENNMIDMTGFVAEAAYNRNVKMEIDSYDIYADMGEGENLKTYNLATTPLKAGMKDFRVEFGGKSIKLEGVTVTPSVYRGVTNQIAADGVSLADDASYVYDVDASGALTITVSGKSIAASQAVKTQYGLDKANYIAFRLLGTNAVALADIKDIDLGITGQASIKQNGDAWDIWVYMAVDGTTKNTQIVLKNAEKKTIDNSTIKVVFTEDFEKDPKVASLVEYQGDVTFDKGGEVVVTYTSDKAIPADVQYNVGPYKRSEADINGTKKPSYGALSAIKVERSADNKTVKVTYKLEAANLTGSTAFTSSFLVGLTDKDGNSLAEETLRYTFKFANDGGFTKIGNTNVYAMASDELLILAYAYEPNGNIIGKDVVATLNLNIQNKLGLDYDVSIKLNADKTASFVSANELTLADGSTALSVINGTPDYTDDYDFAGMIYAQLDLTALGIREDAVDEAFYFEATQNRTETGTVIYKVAANAITGTPTVYEGERTTLQPLSCVTDEIKAYKTADGFYYGTQVQVASGVHTWAAVTGKTNVYTCSECGSYKSQGAMNTYTTDGEGKITVTAGTEIAKIEGVSEKGLTLFFNVKGATDDWAAIVNVDGMAVTLPNLDPWWNTTNGKFPTEVNCTPAPENKINGHEWDTFKNCECSVAISISPTNGVTYYKNGVKAIEYPATKGLQNNTTVAGFVKVLFELIEEKGFTFAGHKAVGAVTNLAYVTAALNEEQVQASALQLGYNTNLALGKTDNTTGYTGTAPLWTGTILKGEKIVVKGKATATGAAQWNSPIAYLWSGEVAEVNFRADNYINAAAQEKQESQNFAFKKDCKGFDKAGLEDWVAAFKANFQAGACDMTITWDYTDATKIVVTYNFTWGDATFTQAYEVTAITGTLLDTYKIGLGVDGAHLTATSCEYTYAAPAQA